MTPCLPAAQSPTGKVPVGGAGKRSPGGVATTPRGPAQGGKSLSKSSVAQGRRRERVERMARERKGIALYRERGEEIEHLRGRLWAVPSCSGEGLYLVDLHAEICGCPDFEHREENCKHIYAAVIASAKSSGCAGCGRKVRRRKLREVGPENLTFFEGDELRPSCAVAHGVA